MTATAEYADYVLPDCTVFEREDMEIGYAGHVLYLEKAIEPMYECRPPLYFWSELARRLGFGGYFDKTMDEWIALRLKTPEPSLTGAGKPLTLEGLKKEKVIKAKPKAAFHPFLDKKFPTPSGRIELYSEELIPANDALPVFREQLESPRSNLAKKYPLVFNTANNKFFMHSMFSNDPSILKLYQTEPHLSIHPEDANKRDIEDEDVVEVFNDRGKCRLKAMINEAVPPGVVHVPHGWSPKQFIQGHLQNLLLPTPGRESRDQAREIYWDVVVERAGIQSLGFVETRHAYSPDILFDCLCEVRKVEERLD
jgi:molybdopterin-containing oxidoreductase family molybdopterin binding subunit